MSGLDRVNRLRAEEAETAFLQCCGSTAWAHQMATARPFARFEDLLNAAAAAFDGLGPEAWQEAFASHPRLGEKKNAKQSDTANQWSATEQNGMTTAAEDTKQTLATLNERYFERHGFTFILCASGRSATEMVEAIQKRLPNSPEDERRIAANEQRKITRLRIERLMET